VVIDCGLCPPSNPDIVLVGGCQLLTLPFLKVIKTVKWLPVCRLGCELDEEIVEFLVEAALSLFQSIQTTSVTIQSPLQ